MEEDFQITETIDRYLRGELEGEALREMEQKIRDDAAFSIQVENRKTALQVIAVAGREQMREKLKEMHRRMETDESGKKGSRRWRYISIAAVILLLLIPVWFLLSPTASSPEELYQEYFLPGADRTFSGAREGEDAGFEQAVQQFKQGDYAESSPVFQARALQYPDSAVLRLYNGVAFLGLGESELASIELLTIATGDESVYVAAAEWYMGLLELSVGNKLEARKFLRSLANDTEPSEYADRAEEILDSM